MTKFPALHLLATNLGDATACTLKLKLNWDQFPRSKCYGGSRQLVTRKLPGSWRRRQQVREEVTGKLVLVEFELKAACPIRTH